MIDPSQVRLKKTHQDDAYTWKKMAEKELEEQK